MFQAVESFLYCESKLHADREFLSSLPTIFETADAHED